MKIFWIIAGFLFASPCLAMDLDVHAATGISFEDDADFGPGVRPGFSAGLSFSVWEPVGLFLAIDAYWTLPVLTSEWVVYRGQLGGMSKLGIQYDAGSITFIENFRLVAGAQGRLGAYQYTETFLFYPGFFIGVRGEVLKFDDAWAMTGSCDFDWWFRKDLVLAFDVKPGLGVKYSW